MTTIDVRRVASQQLNRTIKDSADDCELTGCLGERFIGAGLGGKTLDVHGIPGNALGAYLDGATIRVFGNAQDAVGDTMNAGRVIIHGSVGDACGYAMRGGEIYVQGNAGYRAGVHMKAYGDTCPVMVIGGHAGSFLGEYQAGGLIIVLGLEAAGKAASPVASTPSTSSVASATGTTPAAGAPCAGPSVPHPIVSNFPCTGMHGGKVILRGTCEGVRFPEQLDVRPATTDDLAQAAPYVRNYGAFFDADPAEILAGPYTVVSPRQSNPYNSFYVGN